MATVQTFATIDGFPIDAALSEDHAFDSTVTDYPVEKGADISDNIHASPIVITMDCVVSDSPLGQVAVARAQQTASGGIGNVISFGNKVAQSLPGLGGNPVPVTYSIQAFAFLLALRNAKKLVTIRTSIGTFDNMVLTSMSVPRNKATGSSLSFKVTFKQIRLVTNQLTSIPTATPQGKAVHNLGTLPAIQLDRGAPRTDQDADALLSISGLKFN